MPQPLPRAFRRRHDAPVRPLPAGAKPPVVTQAMRDWWLGRYSVEEIQELAAGLGESTDRG